MKCPMCQETLLMSERQGVEIDYCPKCRGVWLDRGELEKLVQASLAHSEPAPSRGDRRSHDHDDDYRERRDESQHQGKYKKRESWLGELFDFD